MTKILIFACPNINVPAGVCEWVKPIIGAEEDKLTTAARRALLAHNLLVDEFCR